MTAEIVAGFTTASRAASGLSITIDTPGHAQGDDIYVSYVSDGDGDTATLDGFSALYSNIAIGTTGVFCLFRKTAGASEPADYTVNNTVSERAGAVAWAVRGGTDIDVQGSNQVGSSGTATVPGFVTTVDNCLRISLVAGRSGAAPYGTAGNHTKITDLDVVSGGAQTVQWQTLYGLGTYGSEAISLSASGNWVGISFAIAPSVTGGISGSSAQAFSFSGSATGVATPISIGTSSQSFAFSALSTGTVDPLAMEYEAVLLALRPVTSIVIDTDSKTPHGVAAGDLLRAQHFTGNEVYQSDLQVLSVQSSTRFTVALIGGSTPPAVGMDYVRIGSATNPDRQGSLHLSASDTNAPYMDIVTGIASFDDFGTPGTIKGRLGELTGITSVPNEYGIIAGDGNFTTTGQWFKASNLGVILNNIALALYYGGVQRVNISPDGQNIWVGLSPEDKRLSWDGSNLAIVGSVTVTSGSVPWAAVNGVGRPADNATVGATWGVNIGSQPANLSAINAGEGANLATVAGWRHPSDTTRIDGGDIYTGTVTADAILAGSITGDKLNAASYVAIGNASWGADGIQLQYNGGNPRAYIGNGGSRYFLFDGTTISWQAANTQLDTNGNLIASNVNVSGAITATSGSISGTLNITGVGAITTGDAWLNDSGLGMWSNDLGSDNPAARSITWHYDGNSRLASISAGEFDLSWVEVHIRTHRPKDAYLRFNGYDVWHAGNLNPASYMPIGGGTFTGNVTFQEAYVNSWFRVNSSGGIYWQTYAGGWHMEDTTWMRTYNNKSIYAGSGNIAGEGGLALGSGGAMHAGNGGIYAAGKIMVGNTSDLFGARIQTSGNVHAQGAVTAEMFMQIKQSTLPNTAAGHVRLWYSGAMLYALTPDGASHALW